MLVCPALREEAGDDVGAVKRGEGFHERALIGGRLRGREVRFSSSSS